MIKKDLTCIVRKVSFVRRTKYSRKLYELNDCDVRSMLWYKLKTACRLGAQTDIFKFFASATNPSLRQDGVNGQAVSNFHTRDLIDGVEIKIHNKNNSLPEEKKRGMVMYMYIHIYILVRVMFFTSLAMIPTLKDQPLRNPD